jgi:hypothetical protein
MTRVPVRLGDHANQDVMARDVALTIRPPRHLPCGVKAEGSDRRIRVRPRSTVQSHQFVPRLVSSGPHVRVDLCVRFGPGQGPGGRSPEGLTEEPEFNGSQMLYQTQQVCFGDSHRPTDVVFRKTIKLPHQGVPRSLQIAMHLAFEIRIHHVDSLPPGYRTGNDGLAHPLPAPVAFTQPPSATGSAYYGEEGTYVPLRPPVV